MPRVTPLIEKVPPDDGQRESYWVLLVIGIILLIGGIGIAQHQTPPVQQPHHLVLSVADKAILMALQNAGEEIAFLHNTGTPYPHPDRLKEEGVPPFAVDVGLKETHRWRQITSGCYVGTPIPESLSSQFLFLLIITEGNNAHVYWQGVDPHVLDQLKGDCDPDEHWQVFNNA